VTSDTQIINIPTHCACIIACKQTRNIATLASATAQANKAAAWDGIFYNLLFFFLLSVKNKNLFPLLNIVTIKWQ
jgi:hypothetical protein